MKSILMLPVILALTLAGCETTTQTQGTGPFPPGTGRIEYPLEAGGSWNYDESISISNVRPPGLVLPGLDTTIKATIAVRSLGRGTLRDSIQVWKFHAIEEQGGFTYLADEFYSTRGDTLFLAGYSGAVNALPKQHPSILPGLSGLSGRSGQSVRFSFAGRLYGSIGELVRTFRPDRFPVTAGAANDTFFEAPQPRVLVFPLIPGLEWNYRESGNPWRIGKKVIGPDWTITRAGFFQATRIQWFWDINNRGVWDSTITGFDLVSPRGLIRRSIRFKDMVAYGPDSMEPLGYFDVTTEDILTSTNVL